MSLNESFNKTLPVMHISVRDVRIKAEIQQTKLTNLNNKI